MGLLRDDRGQAIQVGAAILLGFVVITITMYQVEVVPSQNAEIEFDHSQAVQEDLQDLRNAITNAAAREHSQSVSLSLGTQFPARTIFVNPPPASGSVQTVDGGNVTIENAAVDPDSEFGADAQALLDTEHETARIEYRPNYREYRGGPTTVVEHSLAYNQFADATLATTRQSMVRGDRLRLPLIDGELSEQGTRSLTIDAETVAGPTDDVPIGPADEDEPIVLHVPAADPVPWNESIGTTYGEGEADARVAGYENGTLTIELDRDDYRLRMAKVGVGVGATEDDRYDVQGPATGGGAGSSPAYDVDWQDPSGQSGVEDDRCDADRCVVDGEEVELTVGTDPIADGADVTYAVSDRSVATVASSTGTTDDAGEDVVAVAIDDDAETGDTAFVYASSGADGDRIELEVNRTDGTGPGPTLRTRLDDLSHEDSSAVEYLTSFDVEGAEDDYARTEAVYENTADGSATETVSSTAERGTLRYTSTYGFGDEYDVQVRVIYEDADGEEFVATEQSIVDEADTTNPDDNDDLSGEDSPQITDFEVEDIQNPGQGPRWDVTFELDSTAEFSEAELYAIGLGNAGVDSETGGTPDTYRLNPDYGDGEEFRIVLLVKDTDDAVVDARRITDVADGTDP